MNNGVRRITDGAMMVALIGVLLFLNRQIFGAVEYIFWIIPLPMVFYSVKYGFKNSVVVLSAVAFLTFLYGTITSIFLFNSMAICGAIYGNAVRNKQSSRVLLLISVTFLIFANLITGVLFAGVFGYDIIEEILFLEKSLVDMGVSLETLGEGSFNILFQVYVASTILLGLISGILLHVLSLKLLKRLKFEIPASSEQWIPPKWSGYIAVCLWQGGAYLIKMGTHEVITSISTISLVLSLFYLMYFGMGVLMKVISKRMGKGIALLFVVILVVFLQYTLFFLALVGFLSIVMPAKENQRRVLK